MRTGLYNFYFDQINKLIIKVIKLRRMRYTGHVPRVGDIRNEYRVLVGKRQGKNPLRWRITSECIRTGREPDVMNAIAKLLVPQGTSNYLASSARTLPWRYMEI